MENFDIYRDIAERTNGDIYIGVVGPVRTGKSTFIANFMNRLVLPGIENPYARQRAQDELPQSASGLTIMTTQPKFVPNTAVDIKIGDNIGLRLRMVDCVGYMVDGALGTLENQQPRMVKTPWLERELPFEQAAEIGTRKVINEHSTLGIVVTCDGSFTEIPRSSYINAEERVVRELKAINKPFIMILNTAQPRESASLDLRASLEKKYDVPVKCMDVTQLSDEDIDEILHDVLFEFPITNVDIQLPAWVYALDESHWLVSNLLGAVRNGAERLGKLRSSSELAAALSEFEHAKTPRIVNIDPGNGSVTCELPLKDGLFNSILSEQCGTEITSDAHLLALLKELTQARDEYDRVADALESVRRTGYGMVPPSMDELELEEPKMVKQGSHFGVKLKATAPSLHMIRVDIQTEVSPVVGTEKQSEELVKYLLEEFENDPEKIWGTKLFGKSLDDLMREGLANKLTRMPDDVRQKVQTALSRIINDGHGGIICILL